MHTLGSAQYNREIKKIKLHQLKESKLNRSELTPTDEERKLLLSEESENNNESSEEEEKDEEDEEQDEEDEGKGEEDEEKDASDEEDEEKDSADTDNNDEDEEEGDDDGDGCQREHEYADTDQGQQEQENSLASYIKSLATDPKIKELEDQLTKATEGEIDLKGQLEKTLERENELKTKLAQAADREKNLVLELKDSQHRLSVLETNSNTCLDKIQTQESELQKRARKIEEQDIKISILENENLMQTKDHEGMTLHVPLEVTMASFKGLQAQPAQTSAPDPSSMVKHIKTRQMANKKDEEFHIRKAEAKEANEEKRRGDGIGY